MRERGSGAPLRSEAEQERRFLRDSCGIPGSGSLRGGPVRQQHPQSEPPPLKLRVSHSGSDVTPAQTRKPPGRRLRVRRAARRR